MKAVISIIIIAVVVVLGLKFRDYARHAMAEKSTTDSPPRYAPGKLRGLPFELEASFEEAKRGGADGLHDWLRKHRAEVEEPRLTDIELDYVLLAGRESPAEARRVLNTIKQRIPTNSPVFKRFQQLDHAYP
ncbi:MAG: hypothetical protein ABSC03_05770 [Verrucomicrobiota bacterium]|jgi:hypothetical protein